MAESWAPTLADTARHIPTRTRDTRTPGSDALLGTFTPATTPTDSDAQAVIDQAVTMVISVAGVIPPVTDPAYPQVSAAARSAAEWRAAADIEFAYPNRDADIRVARDLDARAVVAMTALERALQQAGEGAAEPMPVWMAPDPPPWADRDPGERMQSPSPWDWTRWF